MIPRAVAVLLALTTPALAQTALPDPARTPGAINPEVTQATLGSTICRRGWTRTVRPPQAYTSALKRQQIREFGYADRRMGDYEEDHLIPLSLLGDPYNPRNLWPEPRTTADGWNADHPLSKATERRLLRALVIRAESGDNNAAGELIRLAREARRPAAD
jgi:hypothetical protein